MEWAILTITKGTPEMRRMILGLFFMGLAGLVKAQVAAEDAKGQSSIIYNGSSIALGIAEASLTANWNNLNKLGIAKKYRLIWGLSTSTKNQEGLGDLLKTGRLSPESKFAGFVGIRWLHGNATFNMHAERDKLYPFVNDYIKATAFQQTIDSLIDASGLPPAEVITLTKQLEALVSKKIEPTITSLKTATFTAELQPTVAAIISNLEKRKKWLDINKEEYSEKKALIDNYDTHLVANRTIEPSRAYTVYYSTGLNSSKFNRYDPSTATATSLSARIDTVSFRGGFIDLGFNYDAGARWTLGITIGYERFNNLDSLTIKDYSIKASEKVGTEEISSSQPYKAYPGTYIAYNRGNIKFDILYFARVNEDYRLVWNMLYGRFILPFGDSRIKGVINTGTSVTFHKSLGKLAGGIYLQSNDLFNNAQSTDKFGERLSFGLVAKYNFDSIMKRDFK